MALLTYTTIASLDGYVADKDGKFDWAMPDTEVHTFVNDLERLAGTYLYGRRIYEVMAYWETTPDRSQPAHIRDYAEIWQAADKIVYSTSLDAVTTTRTRLERRFDTEAVRRMKATADRDLTIAGPTLAGHALRAGLVDEYRTIVTPIVVGGGTPALPDDVRVPLELADERRFGNGMVYLRYRVRT